MAYSMLDKKNPDDYITCPYEESHRILRSRFQTHLTKCAKEHPKVSLLTCPLNSTHRVSAPEYYCHLDTCPDRNKLDSMVIISEDVNLDKFPIPKAMIEVEPEESWDTVERPSYDPAKYCESNLILQQTKVAGAAKRRQNRFEQRQKFQSLQAVSSDTVKQPKETASDYMKRMPTNIPPPSIIDEQNIFHVVPLMERVKFGAKMAEMEERKVEANAKAEVKQDNCRESSNEANSAGDFVPVVKKGKGRGRHISQK